ncbi:MAG TPA: acyltransferase [Opitutaceae bacterium]|nr:acyltransferase [Opitutaceae bacterium]
MAFRFRGRSVHDVLRLAGRRYWRLKTELWYRWAFGGMGRGCLIERPMLLNRPERITLGDRVVIQPGLRIEVLLSNPGRDPRIEIGSEVNIEQGVHIIAQNLVRIGRGVSICAYSCIVDVDHPYTDVNDPRRIGDRYSDDGATVEIGDGAFIGFGSTVLPGASIGRNAVIGSRSVVGGEIPDYAVAAGAPARILKMYDAAQGGWRRP